jgi:hypothetical protein
MLVEMPGDGFPTDTHVEDAAERLMHRRADHPVLFGFLCFVESPDVGSYVSVCVT